MALVIEIPLAYYQAFIGRCYLESREYHVLRNAIIDHVPVHLRDGNIARLLCSQDDAKLLLRRAKQFYPIAASYIEEALSSPAYRKARSGAASDASPPNAKTLGDILFTDKSKVRLSEDEWLQLVRAVGRGDQRALRSLYEQTHRIVFTLIVRITANQETAEEVTLDVFYDVWRKASTYDPANGSVVGWIMNQARSRAIDRLRFDQRKKRVNTYPDSLQPTTDIVDPQQACLFGEQNRLLRNALEVLTPEERNAIETAFFSEYTYEETARKLNQPLGTVKTRIRSGLGKLREALGRKLKR